MRLFVAIALRDEIRHALASFLNELRVIAPRVKWSRPENLHLTLKFIGDPKHITLHQIENVLSSVRTLGPVDLEFHGLGFFSNAKRPHLIWAGMQSTANLPLLAQSIDRALHSIGFALETKEFAPHLTLARSNFLDLAPIFSTIEKNYSHRTFGSMVANEFHLIESRLKSSGAEYTNVQSFTFFTVS